MVHGRQDLERFFPTYFGFVKRDEIAQREKLSVLTHYIRLQELREGGFYIAIPRHREFPSTQQARVCAIDPGVRNFVTICDLDGWTMSVKDAYAVLKRRFDAVDTMLAQLDVMNSKCKAAHKTKNQRPKRAKKHKSRRQVIKGRVTRNRATSDTMIWEQLSRADVANDCVARDHGHRAHKVSAASDGETSGRIARELAGKGHVARGDESDSCDAGAVTLNTVRRQKSIDSGIAFAHEYATQIVAKRGWSTTSTTSCQVGWRIIKSRSCCRHSKHLRWSKGSKRRWQLITHPRLRPTKSSKCLFVEKTVSSKMTSTVQLLKRLGFMLTTHPSPNYND